MNPEDTKTIRDLKSIGHQLLDEYVDIGVKYRMHGSRKTETSHAYRKLGIKLEPDNINPHFSTMHDSATIIRAITKLRRMISQRKKKIQFRGLHAIQFAPNLRELQANIKQNL